MGRSPCCDSNSLKKGPWTPEEDHKLIQYVQLHGPGNWRNLPQNAGLQRCGKSCRLRWTNYLRPDIKRGRFSFEEEEAIIQLHSVLGNKWSTIASRLPGRTDNEIKNYWNTHIRKRLLKMGIDPVTHSPRLDLTDLSNALNYSNLLGLQSLVNPDLLNLFTSLLASNHENQLFNHIQPQNQSTMIQQPNQFQDCSTSSFPSSMDVLAPNSASALNGQVCQQNLTPYDLSVVNLPNNDYTASDHQGFSNLSTNEGMFGLSNNNNNNNNNNQNMIVNSTTNVSSPTQLNSSSTLVDGSAEDEIGSYCSSLLKFQFPDGFELSGFM